jgi:hypothetical protein
LFNSCRLTVVRLGGKWVANDLEAGSRCGEPAYDLVKLVGLTYPHANRDVTLAGPVIVL